MYADFEFYCGGFMGTKINEERFRYYSSAASDYIDSVTFGRAKNAFLRGGNISLIIKKACCACAEAFFVNDGGGGMSSERLGDYAVNYVAGVSKAPTEYQRVYYAAKRYLGGTGLMSRVIGGIGAYDCGGGTGSYDKYKGDEFKMVPNCECTVIRCIESGYEAVCRAECLWRETQRVDLKKYGESVSDRLSVYIFDISADVRTGDYIARGNIADNGIEEAVRSADVISAVSYNDCGSPHMRHIKISGGGNSHE